LAAFPAVSGGRETDRETARVRKETATMPTPAGDTTISTPGEWVGYRVGRKYWGGGGRGEKGRETATDDHQVSKADLELGGK